jgi:hypothetical protein
LKLERVVIVGFQFQVSGFRRFQHSHWFSYYFMFLISKKGIWKGGRGERRRGDMFFEKIEI